MAEIHRVTAEEGREIFDRAARRYMNMSGEEFLARYDAGEFHDSYSDNHTNEVRVSMLIPFARPEQYRDESPKEFMCRMSGWTGIDEIMTAWTD